MSFLDRIFRSNPFNNPGYPMTEMNVNEFLSHFGGQHRSDSGEIVNAHTAMQTSTVWACVKLISEQIAVNPLFMFQLDGNGNKKLAIDHDYFDIVTNSPNPEQDAIAFRTAVQIDILLHGNGYIEINRDGAGRVAELWHRSADRTQPWRSPTGKLMYRTTDSVDRAVRDIPAQDCIHIMGNTINGYVGLSPIQFAKQQVGGKLAMDKYSARFFANNATPSGIITSVKEIKPEKKQDMRRAWEEQQVGSNQHRVAILDQELKFQQISIPQNDAQFLETKNATAEEIAAMFGVPGYSIGLLSKSVKANVEQQSQDLLNYCLRPWMAKWEKAFTCKLFSARGRSVGRYVVKFDTKELLRPDTASRQTYYQSMIQNGVLSQDEVRDLEGYNAIPGGDGQGYYIQLNMQSLALANSSDPTPNGADIELANEIEENSLPKRLGQNYRGLFKDGVTRLLKNNSRDYKAVYRCLWPTLEAMAQAASQSIAGEHPECDKAVDELLVKIEHRAKKWAEADIESICDDELKKVATSLIYAVNRDEANAKSKKIIDALEAEQIALATGDE